MSAFTFSLPNFVKTLVSEGDSVSTETLLSEGEVFSSLLRLPLSTPLGVLPEKVTLYLKKPIGSDVVKSEDVAYKKGTIFGKGKKVQSPVAGKLLSLDQELGEAVIALDSTPFRFYSPGKGTVTNNKDGRITIDFSGKEISLIEGGGSVVFGELVSLTKEHEEVDPILLDQNLKGKILLAGIWGKVATSKAYALGALGVLGITFLAKDVKELSLKKLRFGETILSPHFSFGQVQESDFLLLSGHEKKPVILEGDSKRLCLLK